MQRFVITHERDGVFVGEALGFAFWSRGDSVGQTRAAAFDDEAQARDHVSSWTCGNDPDDYGYVPVPTTEEGPCVSVQEMLDAGLEDHVGDMWANEPSMANC